MGPSKTQANSESVKSVFSNRNCTGFHWSIVLARMALISMSECNTILSACTKYVGEKLKFGLWRIENSVGRQEIAGYQDFLLFP